MSGNSSFQTACKFCDDHQQVNMYKPYEGAKWVVTNLDGSAHRHNKTQQQPSQQPQQAWQQQPQPHNQQQPIEQLTADAGPEAKEVKEASSTSISATRSNILVSNNVQKAHIQSLTNQLAALNQMKHSIEAMIISTSQILKEEPKMVEIVAFDLIVGELNNILDGMQYEKKIRKEDAKALYKRMKDYARVRGYMPAAAAAVTTEEAEARQQQQDEEVQSR